LAGAPVEVEISLARRPRNRKATDSGGVLK
jgi:hypothetical protein